MRDKAISQGKARNFRSMNLGEKFKHPATPLSWAAPVWLLASKPTIYARSTSKHLGASNSASCTVVGRANSRQHRHIACAGSYGRVLTYA